MEKIHINKPLIFKIVSTLKKKITNKNFNILIDNQEKRIYVKVPKEMTYEEVKIIETEIKTSCKNYSLKILKN